MAARLSVQVIRRDHGIDASGEAAGASIDDVGKALALLSPTPDLFAPLLKVSDTLWSNLGVKNQQRFAHDFNGEYGVVTARFLQAVVHHGCHVAAAWDTANGCFVEIKLPVDVLSMRGTYGADIIDGSFGSVRVEIASQTKGQLFDWGKSKRLAEQIFDRTRFYLTKV